MLQFNFNWDKLSVSTGLTLRNFYFRLYPGAIGQWEVIDFLKALVRHIEPPLLVIWDRLPAHRSRLVREFIELSEGHIETEHLPPYAPELNPVEYIWAYLEAARAAQRLSQGLRGAERARPSSAAPHAPQTAPDNSLLETIFSLLRLTLYYERLNK